MRSSDPDPDLDHPHPRPGSRPSVRRLSARERQVARLVAQGLKDLAIAHHLGISASSVAGYVQHIRQRLELTTRAEIAAWVAPRLDPTAPAGRLRRLDPARTSGSHPDVRES